MPPAATASTRLTVRDESTLTPKERDALGRKPTLDNFAHYAKYSTPKTRLFFAKVYRGEQFLGLAPITKLVKYKSTELLRPTLRKWMGPGFGFLSKRTTYMVDSAFLAFEYTNPFFCPKAQDEDTVRCCVSEHLQRQPDVDTVVLTEPRRDTAWAEQQGYDCFSTSPMVHVDLSGHQTVESYLASLDKKRRKNWRADRRVFDAQGGTFELHGAPIPPAVLQEMHTCLLKSASQSDFCVPFEDVLNGKPAFLGQDQQALVARVDGRIVGFFSFFANGDVMQQCHGGLDYEDSHDVKAYANLINAAIGHGIHHGFKRLSMGTLHNETKRRAGSHLMPVMVGIWFRSAVAGFLTRKLLLKNFQIYRGDVHAEPATTPFDGL